MSVYSSSVSELRSYLYDLREGLVWMWKLPELSQPIFDFWVNTL